MTRASRGVNFSKFGCLGPSAWGSGACRPRVLGVWGRVDRVDPGRWPSVADVGGGHDGVMVAARASAGSRILFLSYGSLYPSMGP